MSYKGVDNNPLTARSVMMASSRFSLALSAPSERVIFTTAGLLPNVPMYTVEFADA